MSSFVEVRPGAYRDSVALMRLSRDVAGLDGVRAATVAMATPLNLDLLHAGGFDVPAAAGPNDLVIAVRADDDAALAAARAACSAGLAAAPGARWGGAPGGVVGGALGEAPPRTVAAAAARSPAASLALVSVPGEHAFVEAMDALAAGLDVVVFSDNVPLWQEVRLKQEGRRRGLLVMGPDCGTAVVGGIGLGFANRVGPGPVGVVAASGTGAQQLMCLLDLAGVGISHCLGVGGRDLSAAVGGLSTRAALAALDADPATELIVVVSKPPAPEVAAEIRALAARLGTPTMLALLGFSDASGTGEPADLTEFAARVFAAVTGTAGGAGAAPGGTCRAGGAGGETPGWPQWAPQPPWPQPRPGALRGLFCGGTLCDEAMAIAAATLGPIASNIPLDPAWALGEDLRCAGHLMIDFGDDRFTAGRPHPMIDPGPRCERLAEEVRDPATSVVLLDVILGYGAHPDPAADLVPVISGSQVPVVVGLVGTPADPQSLNRQAQALRDAGAWVFASTAAATRHAVALVEKGARAR